MRTSPIILTLDAGGTNFVFSAVQDADEIVRPIEMQAHGDDLERCLHNIIDGFERVARLCPTKPAAISFAFPGPADYQNGIIGDLGNLPAFRGGVALGPMLEKHFKIPVFINNDGDLFALGEAKYGFLPHINSLLKQTGSKKKFENLFGVTLGTGFGGGLVNKGELYLGDNGAGAEVWLLRNPYKDNSFAEESLSARAIVREYIAACPNDNPTLTPFDIFCIAKGNKEGNKVAALDSFRRFGYALGEALSDIITIVDAPVVIGGGLSNAYELFAAEMLSRLKSPLRTFDGKAVNRLETQVFDAENKESLTAFLSHSELEIKIPFSNQTVAYDPVKRVCVGISKLGTSKAVWLGAYAFALEKLKP